MYTVGSLFTGIGGIDLAFERAGFVISWQVEIDDYCNRILAKHWPGVPRYRDVRKFARSRDYTTCDVLVGGFPCQDISNAGQGQGIRRGNRSGLWFEFARIIRTVRPRYVFIENVPAIVTRGGTTVVKSLAALGYAAQWHPVSASDAGAPHKRTRWFCVAYRDRAWKLQLSGFQPDCLLFRTGNISQGVVLDNSLWSGRDGNDGREYAFVAEDGCKALGVILDDAQPDGREGRNAQRQRTVPALPSGEDVGDGLAVAKSARLETLVDEPTFARPAGRSSGSVESRLGGIFDGLPGRLDAARRTSRWPARPGEAQHTWEAPRVATGVRYRVARLKALGNAVVPQVVQPFAEGIREALEDEDSAERCAAAAMTVTETR